MRIEGIRTIAGPNVWTHKPVLVMRLNLEELAGRESNEFGDFNERLLARLPGAREHHCALGRPGGFVERLEEGTYFGHIVEHVALELSEGAGIPVNMGKTRQADEPGIYNVIVEYRAEEGMRYLLGVAVELVEALLRGEEFPLEERLEEARRIILDTELGPSTRSIFDAAERRGVPCVRLNDESLVRLGYGRHRRYVQAAMSDATSAIGMEIAGDKNLTKSLLERVSIPVPRGRIVRDAASAVIAMEEMGTPVVVKPLDGRQGRGVSLDLTSVEDVSFAFKVASEYSREVLVEEQFEGRNYRVLVVGGRVVAASERVPCHVRGDGRHTVGELIELENRNPLRGDGHEKPLTTIKKEDPILLAFMRKKGWSMEDVPDEGEVIMLCAGINLSTGGTAKDVTDEVHPSIALLCQRAASLLAMDICGVDLVLRDISKPMRENDRGGVIELNAAPGLRMHQFPSEGQPRDVGEAIVEMLFPGGATGRIPIIAITGTNGKTTVTRMIDHALREAGVVTGMTTTDGIWIGGQPIAEGDTTGPISAGAVLGDQAVEVAVLETARGGIVRRGLGYDWSDIAVMTNIGPDHIGQDGIESVEDILWIKSLVAERVREGGTVVLNADDEYLRRVPELKRVREPRRKIVYFSLKPESEFVQARRAEGGTVYFARGGRLYEATEIEEREVLRVADVSVTMGGAAEFQVSNVLAAIAALRAYGLTIEQCAAAMKSFRGAGDNPGRVNLYGVKGGYVLVDYGHNPDAFEAICRMAANWKGRHVVGIIGVPGDRGDSVVEQAGRVAARGFHRIIIKEDTDLRGRAKGEVARLLCEAVAQERPTTECHVVLDEVEALRSQLASMRAGQVVVVFYDKLEPVLEALREHGAVPVEGIDEVAGTTSSAGARR
jgi:cyanophycin synthetase